ncbi:U3 snoRNP protein [Ancistrocladus abbreviatus]
MTDAGPLDLIDDDNSETEERIDRQTRGKLSYDLPGAIPDQGRPIIRTKCVRIAPTGRSFVAATTEGVLVYSMDKSFIFDPTDLDIDVTPEAVDAALNEDQPSRALILSLGLNEDTLIKKSILSVNPANIPAVASSIPVRYLQRLIEAFSDLMEEWPVFGVHSSMVSGEAWNFSTRWSEESSGSQMHFCSDGGCWLLAVVMTHCLIVPQATNLTEKEKASPTTPHGFLGEGNPFEANNGRLVNRLEA